MFSVDKTLLNAMTCLGVPQAHSVETRNGKRKPFTMGVCLEKANKREMRQKQGDR